MRKERLIVPAMAVVALFALSACTSQKAPQPQANVCAPKTRVIQVQPAQYKYVRVKVKTQPAQYAKIQPVSECDLKKAYAKKLQNN